MRPGQTLHVEAVVKHFARHYPQLDHKTVRKHLEGLSTNNGAHRRNHSNVRSDTDWDYLFKLGPGLYRLYEPGNDPRPAYTSDVARPA